MKKQYYDHRTTLCSQCHHYKPEGVRPDSSVSPDMVWPEGCGHFGYSFHPDRYPEDADDCDGFETTAQYKRRISMMEMKRKKR